MKLSALTPVILFSTLALSACGGGSSSSTPAPAPTPTPTPAPDTNAPVITLNGDSTLTVSAGTAFTDLGATATDAIDGDVAVSATGEVTVDVVNSYTITYSATDAAGNQSTLTRTVNVIDDTAPVISLAGGTEVNHSAGTEYVDAGASATDNVDGDVEVTVTGSVDTSTLNSYTLTYSTTDAAGNETSLTRTVSVVDDVAPVITLTGDAIIAHNYGDDYTDQGATATDNVDASVTVTVTGGVTIDAVNSYTITYTATDAAGNEAIPVVRTVNVTDSVGPVITLNGDNIITLGKGRLYKELGATALDAFDNEAIDILAPSEGTVDNSTIGEYRLTYTATDSKGQQTSIVRTVNIVEPRPFITTWRTDKPGESDDFTITLDIPYTPNFVTVDWGDGTTSTERNTLTHTYTEKGTYTITISGDFTGLDYGYVPGDIRDISKLVSVEQWGDVQWSTMNKAFAGCDNVAFNASDTPNLRQVDDMESTFAYCTNITGNLSDWEFSSGTEMYKMFRGASGINADITSWDVSQVTDMAWMFWDAEGFNQDISAWDVSSVTTMEYMFMNAGDFNQDISAWDISNVRSMKAMFDGVTLSSDNYDALLNSWSQQQVQIGISLDAGNSIPTANSADAKAILTSAPNYWTIYDGSTPR